MAQHTIRTALWSAVIVGVGALLAMGIVAGYYWLVQPQGRFHDFIAARSRWEDRPFARKRLVVEKEGGFFSMPTCRQEVDVDGERVVAERFDGCAGFFPTVSVNGIFGRIEPLVADDVCGVNGCWCDGHLVPTVEYDDALGYPRSLTITMRRSWRDRWLRWPPWKPLTCPVIHGTEPGPDITVVSITPLP
jgi:hypothetical protein